MGEVVVFMCETCKRTKASEWSGPPRGWVRLDAEASWDGTNYHIIDGGNKKKRTFCSIKCFVKFMELGSRYQGGYYNG